GDAVADLRAAHGRRGRLSHPEERALDPPDLASAHRSGASAHLGVLPRLRAVEDARAVAEPGRLGQQSADDPRWNSTASRAPMWCSRWPTISGANCESAASPDPTRLRPCSSTAWA